MNQQQLFQDLGNRGSNRELLVLARALQLIAPPLVVLHLKLVRLAELHRDQMREVKSHTSIHWQDLELQAARKIQ